MKSNKRFKKHLQKAYEHNESARELVIKELQEGSDNPNLVKYKLQMLDIGLALKKLVQSADSLLDDREQKQ